MHDMVCYIAADKTVAILQPGQERRSLQVRPLSTSS